MATSSIPPAAGYDFGPFRLEPATRRLLRGSEEIDLRPKAFDLLVLLVAHRDRALGKDELMALLWPDTAVEEGNLAQCVFLLRRALGQRPDGEELIATVSRFGYRFVAPVTETLPEVGNAIATAVPGGPDGTAGAARVARAAETSDASRHAARFDRTAVRRHRARWIGMLLFTGTVAVLSTWALSRRSPPAASIPPAMVSLHLVGAPPIDVDVAGPVAVSPDGRFVAVVARAVEDLESSLWLRAFDDETARRLEGTAGASMPFWSPDGTAIGFFADGKLKRVAIAGGPPDTLCDAPNGRGGTWNRREVILFSRQSGPHTIERVSATGGRPSPVTTLGDGESAHRWPVFLPDGDRFLYSVQGKERGLHLGRLSGGAPRRVLDVAGRVQVTADRVLFVRGKSIRAQRFDSATAGLIGEPTTIPLWPQLDGSGSSIFSASNAGAIVYLHATSEDSELRWFDRAGNELGQVGRAASYFEPRLSPDGRYVAVDITTWDEYGGDVWILPAAAASADAPPTRLTHDQGNESLPIWSPDGSRVLFLAGAFGAQFDLFEAPASGLGVRQEILRSPYYKWPNDWSPDGELVLYMSLDASLETHQGKGLWSFSLADRQSRPLLPPEFGHLNARLSPDGEWLAFAADPSGHPEVYVRDFPNGRTETQVSSGGGDMPVWSRDGRELYYHAPAGNRLMAVPFDGNAVARLGPARVLFTLRRPLRTARTLNAQYDVSPDGRFLVNMMRSEPGELTLLLNALP
jgi:Tol biopolymer transport system component/DNA-binding winged helix-turn-helix (wHTH) protein